MHRHTHTDPIVLKQPARNVNTAEHLPTWSVKLFPMWCRRSFMAVRYSIATDT